MTSYEMAKEKYAAWGVDTEKAMEQLKRFRFPSIAGSSMM